MLTSDLLVARVRKGLVQPEYCDPSAERALELAQTVIAIHEGALGLSREELEEQIDGLCSGLSTELKFVKGLAKLCSDRSEFQVDSSLEPELIRAELFARAAEARKTERMNRSQLLAESAVHFQTSVEVLERGLYADLRANEKLIEFKPINPEGLLERYNLALAQAVLFRATNLVIEVREPDPAHYRRLFRALKFHRLLHSVQGDMAEGYQIEIDGPMSLFQKSQQYGLRMASFLPSLILGQNWRLCAQVQWGPNGRVNRGFDLDSSRGLKSTARDVGIFVPEEIQKLKDDWPVDSDWEMIDETEIITLSDRGVLIPDFAFRNKVHGRKVLLEVLGYWNRNSLEKRLELIESFGPKDLIVACSRDLMIDREQGDRPEGFSGAFYSFRSFPLRRELLKILKDRFAEAPAGKRKKAKATDESPAKKARKRSP
jgi:predicted nuclease of restriction endonuclease-like RecB superfamily